MHDDQEFDLFRALSALRRQWRLIAVTFLVAFALAGLGIFALPPSYTASALILVDPTDKNLLDPTAPGSAAASADARVDSEVQIITAESTLLKLMEDARLREDPEFAATPGMIEQLLVQYNVIEPQTKTADEETAIVLNKVRRAVRAHRNGLTFLISISATADDAPSSATIANTLAQAYIRAQLTSKIEATTASRDIIEERVSEASAAVVETEEALDDFIASSIEQIVAETGRTDLARLQEELRGLNESRAQAAESIDAVERGIALDDWRLVAQTLQSETLSGYELRQRELQQQLAATTAGSAAEASLKAELAQVISNMRSDASSEVSALRTQVASAQARASDLQVTLRSAIMTSDLPPAIVTNIYELQQTAELARSQYQTLLTRLKDLEAQAYLQVADSRVVSAASVPEQPSFPDTKLLLALAGLGAFALGIALALLRENVVGGFTADVQLSSVLKMPVASTIPRIRAVEDDTKGIRTNTLANQLITSPFSYYSEAIRRLQVGIDQAIRRGRHNRDRGGAVIMVGSANANEGKTTLSLSLTRAYSLSGQRTLLIDCDLRKPSVHAHLGVEPSARLLDYLNDASDGAKLDSLPMTDHLSEAKVVIGARRADMEGRQVITGEYFGRLIEAAKERFDIVLLDTPPVGAVVDGLHLAQFADVIVLSTRYATTSQRDARAALNALSDAKRDDVEILGVLSMAEQSKRANRKRYGSYYSDY